MWTLSAFSDEAGASCDEQIAAAQRARLLRIDIRSIDGFNITVLPLENAKIIKTKLNNVGVSVQMFSSPIGKIDILDDVETDVEKLRHLAALASILGCNAVRIFSYYNKMKIPHADWREKSLTNSVHLKDSTSENMHVPVGLGNGQVEKILRDAVVQNWNGPVTIKPHLARSGAVVLTGPSGIVNESYANMPSAESFHLAVETAMKLLNAVD